MKSSNRLRNIPIISRPAIPAIYGIPKDETNLLPWKHVTERMAEASIYWVSTTGPKSRPHATPVDGIWADEVLYFGGDPKTRRQKNLASNPEACIHLESGTDVVILHGEVVIIRHPDTALTKNLARASQEKYGYGPTPEMYQEVGVSCFSARMVLAWKDFPKDATRFRFPVRPAPG